MDIRMSSNCQLLLHPESLSDEMLIQVLKERYIKVLDLEKLSREKILEIFHKFCVPYAQRKCKDNGRGKLHKQHNPIEFTSTPTFSSEDLMNRLNLNSESMEDTMEACPFKKKELELSNNSTNGYHPDHYTIKRINNYEYDSSSGPPSLKRSKF